MLFVLAIAGGVYAFADKVMAIGKTSASVDKIDRIEAGQNQMAVDSARTKMQVDMMETEMTRGFADVNAQLSRLNLTRENHGHR